LEFIWTAPATPPPKGTWAGQMNRLGYRYNRYTDGSGYCWIPIWPISLIPIAVSVLLISRRWKIIYVLGLVPLILTLLCVRSLVEDDIVWIDRPQSLRALRVHRGQIAFLNVRSPAESTSIWSRLDWQEGLGTAVDQLDAEMRPRLSNLFGFGVDRATSRGITVDTFAVPYWPLIVLSLVVPVLVLRRDVRTRRRGRLNQCLACGYDLRETPERCPECGAQGARLRPQLPASSAT